MSKPEKLNEWVTLHEGDAATALGTMPDNSIDAITTDPPYGLKFMGQKWDYDVPTTELWAEALRVLKPGGHLLAFAGTRTQHRMAVRIEDAGFEIRDLVMWVYGSGFPKSLDVSKAMDKAGEGTQKQQAELLRHRRTTAQLSRGQVAEQVGCTESSVRDWEEGRARASGGPIEFIVPSEPYRSRLAELLGYSSDERRMVGLALDRRDDGTVYDIGHSGEMRTGGHTGLARQWSGWGTALKPACEPITLARKPLDGTVAQTVAEWGTGAINVDACRVETHDKLGGGAEKVTRAEQKGNEGWTRPWMSDPVAQSVHAATVRRNVEKAETLGRFPANLIHDGSDEVLAGFPQTESGKPCGIKAGNNNNVYGQFAGGIAVTGFGDTGSAARFFYCAKANAEERAGGSHPTVKPLALMRYLVRLVTPPGGKVLDMYGGTGTTAVAAMHGGFSCVLVEREAEYCEIIRRRVNIANGRVPGSLFAEC